MAKAKVKAKKAEVKRRASGEGSLAQNKTTGLWEVRVELPVDLATGKRRRRVIRRASRDDAVAELRELQRDLNLRGDLPTALPTVAQWLDFWYREIDILKSKPKSRATRRSHISQYLVPAIGTVRLNRIADDNLKDLLDLIVVKKGLARSTARNIWTTLEVALNAAVSMRKIPTNYAKTSIWRPDRSTPKVGVLSVDQGKKVLRTLDADEDRLAARWKAALLAGMRQGEALGIELDRVNLVAGEVDLSWQLQALAWSHGCRLLRDGTRECGTKYGTSCPERFLDGAKDMEVRHLVGSQYLVRPKTKRSHRVIPLVGDLRRAIEARITAAAAEPNPFGLLFTADPKRRWYAGTKTVITLPLDGMPIDPSTDNKRWHALLERSDVPQVRLHDARRTTVSLLYSLKAPEYVIQDLVGHTESRTTQSYRAPNEAVVREALSNLDDLLKF
jgi:integrase